MKGLGQAIQRARAMLLALVWVLGCGRDVVVAEDSSGSQNPGIAAEALKRLPALPMPEFTLPASLAPFGLPANQRLGLRQPSFSLTRAHGLLQGSLGLE